MNQEIAQGIRLSERIYKYYTKDEKSIRTDGIFQTALGNQAYPEILKNLLESILHIKIGELTVSAEKNIVITKVNNMMMRFDLYVLYDKNNQVDIEMQNENCYNIIQRLETNVSAIYHNAHKKVNKSQKANRYSKNMKAKAIAFLDYNEFEDGPYHEIARVARNSNGEQISDDIEYHFIQMPKFFEQVKEIKTQEEAWIAYLSNQLNPNELEEVFKMNKNIRDLDKIAKEVIDDDELMGEIDKELIRRANDYTAKVGMFNQGLKEGGKERQIKIAKKMIEAKKSIEEIMEFTELSKEEIEKLM